MRNVVATRLRTVAADARALAAVAALALCAAAAPPAAAADTCPNATLREQQGATRLPECRAYELVSPPDKNGNAVMSTTATLPTGGALLYTGSGAFAGSQSSIFAHYRADRTASGWTTTALNFATPARNGMLFDEPELLAATPDLQRVALATQYPVDPLDVGPVPDDSRTYDTYLRGADGAFAWPSRGERLPMISNANVEFAWASEQLDQFVFETRRALTSEVGGESVEQLYLRAGDTLALVSVGPDGRPMRASVRLGTNGGSNEWGGTPRAVSDDGRTIAFQGIAQSGLSNNQLWVRTDPLDPSATTRLVSRASAGDGCAGAITYLAMSADGATILFGCSQPLNPGDPAGGGMYAYDVASDTAELVTPDLGGSRPASSQLGIVAAAPDLSSVYFTSRGRLTEDARDGSFSHLYALHEGEIALVASVGGLTWTLSGRAVVDESGRWLAFETNRDLRSEEFPSNGRWQVYRYDADADALACASCRPDGRPAEGASVLTTSNQSSLEFQPGGGPYGNIGVGGRLFFTSSEALVDEDVNGVADAYASIDGRLHLLTSGSDPNGSVFTGASADGRDAYVLTHESLVAQDVDQGITDVYAVRVDGGFPAPAPPAPGCAGDCQGPLQTPPVLPDPGTVTFRGPGDEDERLEPHTAAVLRVAPLSARQRARLATRGRVTLLADVSHAGRVQANVRARLGKRWISVASASRRVAEGGTVRLPLRLSDRARRALRRTGRLPLRVRVSYSLARGAESASLVLRRAAARGGRR